MFERIKGQKSRTIAMQHCAGSKHFGIDQCPTRQQPMEKPAVPVSPFHHWRDTKRPVDFHSWLAFIFQYRGAGSTSSLIKHQVNIVSNRLSRKIHFIVWHQLDLHAGAPKAFIFFTMKIAGSAPRE